MLRNGTLYQLLTAASWLACACAADTSTPTSRANSSGGRATVGTAKTDATASAMGSANPTATAGSAAPVLPPATTVVPKIGTGDPNVCEVVQLVADPQVPDMMIVLDRSGSMQEGGRWMPSVSAVRKITQQLQSRIRFGLALFPEDTQMTISSMSSNGNWSISFGGGDTCAPGKVVVPIAEMNAGPIGMKLDMTFPNGGTPTSETLMKLLDTYAAMDASPDAKVHPKYVLLVTDGAPTCPNGNGGDPNQADIDLSYRAVEALTDQMVKTYVIGYDTMSPGNEMLAQVLDGLAQRGGTGDMTHRPVEDEASLTAALESIASTIATCSFALDKAPARADYVLVTLDGKQLNLDDANGWRMVDDKTVEIVGEACNTFKSGAHLLNAQVQCMVVTPS